MLLQPKHILAEVLSASIMLIQQLPLLLPDSAWLQKGMKSPVCLWWMPRVSASWMNWSSLRAEWWTTAPGHLHKPFLFLCLSELQPCQIQAVTQDLSETPWFAEMLAAFPSVLRIQFLLCDIMCTVCCTVPMGLLGRTIAILQCPWESSVTNDTQYMLLFTPGYKIRWSP